MIEKKGLTKDPCGGQSKCSGLADFLGINGFRKHPKNRFGVVLLPAQVIKGPQKGCWTSFTTIREERPASLRSLSEIGLVDDGLSRVDARP